MPKISIIIPVYNTDTYLPACLDSIIAQTHTDFEAILVDDGSTDKSGEICDQYAEKDSRFIVIHKQNGGVSKARMTAFEHSKGELITFIDSDDIVDAEYLRKLSKPIIDFDADMVTCDYYFLNEDGSKTWHSGKLVGVFEGENIKEFITNHYFFSEKIKDWGITHFLCTKMMKRAFVKLALAESFGLWYGEDQVAVFHTLYNCRKFVSIPDRLYYYVRHGIQASNRYDESLWNSIISVIEKCKQIDKYNIASEGIRKRTWSYISYTIFVKMAKSGMNKDVFCKQLSNVRETSFMNNYFKSNKSGYGFKQDIKYWLLKLKLYSILYFIAKH